MARALPFHVRQLFTLMQTLGSSQTQCAEELGLSRQAVNNWACGWNVPTKYRGPLASLVHLAIERALAEASRHSPEALAHVTQTIDRYVQEWVLENNDARGGHDAWYAALGQKLALTWKTPLSAQGVEAWKAALGLYLEAANRLRGLIQRHEMTPPAVDSTLRPARDYTPAQWFWFLAEFWAGGPLPKSAALQQWEEQAFQAWLASQSPDRREALERFRGSAGRQGP